MDDVVVVVVVGGWMRGRVRRWMRGRGSAVGGGDDRHRKGHGGGGGGGGGGIKEKGVIRSVWYWYGVLYVIRARD